ncbi:hypothetical protein FRB94_012567 [Tulasnella sp. JGI-2019a]|nr:hypothetical protein FRB94_012567 [Tulasnella sp. JGI-2019a]
MAGSSAGLSIRGAMKSDSLASGPSSATRGASSKGSLLNRIAAQPELSLRPPPANPSGRSEQDSPSSTLPSKRSFEAPTEPNGRVKRVKINRNNANAG